MAHVDLDPAFSTVHQSVKRARVPSMDEDPRCAADAAPVSLASRLQANCRFCGHPIGHVMADLGMQPIANAYRKADELNKMEPFFPLRALVCENCLLVQAQEFETAGHIFSNEYAYFSSFADSWVAQARRYASSTIERFGLTSASRVVEIACNDGYLLRWFKDAGIPVFGVEPTANTARAAQALGIDVDVNFFGKTRAEHLRAMGHAADLMPANNVVAHVPDINDFIAGFKVLLKPHGVATFEFHHVYNLLARNQFDTIYHEHYYYHSLNTFRNILARHGLQVFDVEELPSHGGSLRVYAQHEDTGPHRIGTEVERVLAKELAAGLDTLAPYLSLEKRIRAMKRQLLSELIDAKSKGKRIAAYGAPAKGNTLLNYAGVRTDFVDYTVDRNPVKQNTYLPGTLIPIFSPDKVFETRPDLLLVLVWNLLDEVMEQMQGIREWNGQFLVLLPEVGIY